jgi:predicted metalloprotease with PDZ domain
VSWRSLAVAVFAAWPVAAAAQTPVAYRLNVAADGATKVHVTLTLPAPASGPASFVMPRGYPGGYSVVPYDAFIENIVGHGAGDRRLAVTRETYGPRWLVGAAGERVTAIEYDIDIARMERTLASGVESSKVRPGYAGLLGYSVFGFVDGFERQPVRLSVHGPVDWPIVTTLAPSVPAPRGAVEAPAAHFDALADSQILMGPSLHLRKADGPIGLVFAAYAEGAADLEAEMDLAKTALDRVQRYYGDAPFPSYTVHLELLKPLEGHDYGFSQEHDRSGTFSLALTRAIGPATTPAERNTIAFNYAHHIAHSWVPKRAYGEGYAPFTWEVPPVIDTIWFNEGFGRYSAIVAMANGLPAGPREAYRASMLSTLRTIVDNAPPFIQRMTLPVLSRTASYMYSEDFRLGRNVFARGALMAAEMDEAIQAATQGGKSLRDVLNGLVARTTATARPFTTDEFPGLVRQATGVDVTAIFNRWMRAPGQ